MTDWTEGYVTEIGYTYGYYQELNPLRACWALLNAGYEPPSVGPNGWNVCELGFGQGVSLNAHAAAIPGSWWGTDFNPAQAAFASKLARASGAPIHVFDDAFSQFAERDTPMFDFIGLHGIWSWVSDENRKVIVDFVRRKLRVGGVLYVSYNSLPGWATGMPLRRLMVEYERSMAAPGTTMTSRIDSALEFCERLIATDPAVARANPQMASRLSRIKDQPRSYLAHEYFNRDWKPMYFSEMAEWLAPAKLDFGASAFMLDHLHGVTFTPAQAKLLAEISDPILRETVQDFCVSQQFRRDLWIRGPRRISPHEQAALMREQRVVLMEPARLVNLTVQGPSGELKLNESLYRPVIEALSDHKPTSVIALEKKLAETGIRWPQLKEVLSVLIGSNAIALAQAEKVAQRQKATTDQLNAALIRLSHTGRELTCLVSPVTGGGVTVGRIPQLFLAARSQQLKAPQDWAHYAWNVLNSQGERMLKDGVALQSLEENLNYLQSMAQAFSDAQLPVLKAVGIA